MLRLLVLLAIFISCSMSMSLRSAVNMELSTSDILVDKAKDANGYRTFNVMGKLYKTKFHSEQKNLPMAMISDDQKMERLQKSSESHEMYLGVSEDSSFTVSTKLNERGESVQIVRGNIFNADHELVLEPVYIQRSTTEDDPRPGPPPPEPPKTRLYTRSLDHFNEYLKSKSAFLSESAALSGDSSKSKRQTPGAVDNYVELLTVFDYPFYLFAVNTTGLTDDASVASLLEGYACQLINIANLCFQRSFANVTSLKITLQPKMFAILKTSAVSDFSTKAANYMKVGGVYKNSYGRRYLYSEKAVLDANGWLIRQINAGNLADSFDSAAFITGSDLYSIKYGDVAGQSTLQGACSKGGRGFIVQDYFGLDSSFLFAHELAHNLGVPHDTDNNPTNNTECLTNYIMGPGKMNNSPINNLYFSPCSISKLVSVIATNNQLSCLANSYTLPSDVTTFMEKFYPGQLYNLTEQCRMRFDSTHFPHLAMIGDGSFTDPLICQSLFCTKDGRGSAKSGPALDGSTCASGKWCVEGQCVPTPNIGTGDCLLEEDAAFCANLINTTSRYAVCGYWKTGRCCKYCNQSKTIVPRMESSSITKLIQTAAGANTQIFSQTSMPCDDMSICGDVATRRKSTPSICTSQTFIDGYLILGACPKACGLC